MHVLWKRYYSSQIIPTIFLFLITKFQVSLSRFSRSRRKPKHIFTWKLIRVGSSQRVLEIDRWCLNFSDLATKPMKTRSWLLSLGRISAAIKIPGHIVLQILTSKRNRALSHVTDQSRLRLCFYFTNFAQCHSSVRTTFAKNSQHLISAELFPLRLLTLCFWNTAAITIKIKYPESSKT